MTHLGYLPGTTSASAQAINDSGQVVGFMSTSVGGTRLDKAFSYSGGVLSDLGAPAGGSSAAAYDVNNTGQVVGTYFLNGQGRAFLSSTGAMSDLGTLPGGSRAAAYGISDTGTIVGMSTNASLAERAVSFVGGTVNDLGVLPNGVGGQAQAVNTSGVIVGTSLVRTGSFFNPTFYDRAFLGTQAGLAAINTGYLESAAWDINDAGLAVGSTGQDGPNPFSHGYVFANGTLQLLPSLGSPASNSFTVALAVNEAGTIVGQSNFQAFMYSAGTMVALGTQLVNGTGWTLVQATDINESGQIVGNGFFNGQSAAFLLTPQPVPLPASAWLLGAGLAALFAIRKRASAAN